MVVKGRYPVRPSGPLAEWVHPFREELIGQGFTARTAQDNAYVLAHLSRWLRREGRDPAEFGAEGIAAFAAARVEGGYRRWRSVASLRLMLAFLRGQGLRAGCAAAAGGTGRCGAGSVSALAATRASPGRADD